MAAIAHENQLDYTIIAIFKVGFKSEYELQSTQTDNCIQTALNKPFDYHLCEYSQKETNQFVLHGCW